MITAERRQLPIPEYAETATLGQLVTARLQFYGRLLDFFGEAAEHYAQHALREGHATESKSDIVGRTRLALEDLYFARQKPEALALFKRDWGQEAEVFDSYLNKILPHVSFSREEFEKTASRVTILDRLKVARSSADKLIKGDLAEEQKLHLLKLAGFSDNEAIKILKKIPTSAKLNFGTTLLHIPLGLTAAAWGVEKPFLGDISDPNAQLVMGLAVIGNLTALGINVRQNIRLLRNRSFEYCPNAVAATVYYLLEKMMPEEKKTRDMAKMLLPMMPSLILEGLSSTALSAVDQPSGLVAKNATLIALNLMEALIIQYFLNRNKESSEKPELGGR